MTTTASGNLPTCSISCRGYLRAEGADVLRPPLPLGDLPDKLR